MGTAKGDRISTGAMCELIDKALDGEDGIVATHASPEAGVDSRWLLAIELNTQMGNVVGDVVRGIHPIGIDSLLEEGGQKPGNYRGARHSVPPADYPIAFEPCPKTVVVGRSEDVVAKVFLASPDNLDRSFHVLRDTR